MNLQALIERLVHPGLVSPVCTPQGMRRFATWRRLRMSSAIVFGSMCANIPRCPRMQLLSLSIASTVVYGTNCRMNELTAAIDRVIEKHGSLRKAGRMNTRSRFRLFVAIANGVERAILGLNCRANWGIAKEVRFSESQWISQRKKAQWSLSAAKFSQSLKMVVLSDRFDSALRRAGAGFWYALLAQAA